jgi:hypothetical protein
MSVAQVVGRDDDASSDTDGAIVALIYMNITGGPQGFLHTAADPLGRVTRNEYRMTPSDGLNL